MTCVERQEQHCSLVCVLCVHHQQLLRQRLALLLMQRRPGLLQAHTRTSLHLSISPRACMHPCSCTDTDILHTHATHAHQPQRLVFQRLHLMFIVVVVMFIVVVSASVTVAVIAIHGGSLSAETRAARLDLQLRRSQLRLAGLNRASSRAGAKGLTERGRKCVRACVRCVRCVSLSTLRSALSCTNLICTSTHARESGDTMGNSFRLSCFRSVSVTRTHAGGHACATIHERQSRRACLELGQLAVCCGVEGFGWALALHICYA